MIDKDPGFGVSQFMENARYQHALETELARTIATLRPVEGARVHLAVPRQSAFVRDHQRPPAPPCSCSSSRAAASSRSRSRRSSTWSPPAFPSWMRTRSPWSISRAGCCRAAEGHDESAAARASSSTDPSPRGRLRASASRRCSRRWSAPAACAPRSWRSWTWPSTEQAHEQYKPDSQIVRSEQTSEQTSRDGAGVAGRARRADQSAARRGCRQPPAAAASRARRRQARSCRCPAAANAAAAAAAAAAARRPTARSKQSTTQLRDRSHARLHARSRPASSSASPSRCWSTTCARSARTARPRRLASDQGAARSHHSAGEGRRRLRRGARRQRQRGQRLVHGQETPRPPPMASWSRRRSGNRRCSGNWSRKISGGAGRLRGAGAVGAASADQDR